MLNQVQHDKVEGVQSDLVQTMASGSSTPDNIHVEWRGQEIGTLHDCAVDMWYLDGHFSSNGSPAATEFALLAKTLEPRTVMGDPAQGTRVLLREGDVETHTLVLGLDESRLMLRRTMDSRASNWLLDNVD